MEKTSAGSHRGKLPLVTGAVICYNHARFVLEALESVKAQNYECLHLVVLDDCSTDGSAEIIREWLSRHYPDAIFVAHKINRGICRTMNDLLAHAKGKYIRFLSADDRWIPNTLLRQVEVLEAASEEVGVLYSDAFRIDENGDRLPKMFVESHRPFAKMPEGWIFDVLADGNFIPDAVVRLRCFQAVGGFDESLVFEDWDMWLRISRQFKFKFFPEPTADYRIVQTSMVRTLHNEMTISGRRIIINCLRRGWLTGETKQDALYTEYLEACRAYFQGLPGRVLEAAWTLRHRICIKHALLLLFVSAGLPYHSFEQLIKFLSSVKQGNLRANRGIGRDSVPGA